MTTRRKSTKLDAPQTMEEATALLFEHLDLARRAETLRADADASIAQIEGVRDALLGPVEEALKASFLQLRTWWTANRLELTDGKRKSIELAGALIGERTTPPSLKLERGLTLGTLVEKLLAAGWDDLIRVKRSADKPAILKRLAGDHAREVAAIGVSIHQADEFFIDRAKAKPDDPEVIFAFDVQVRAAGR